MVDGFYGEDPDGLHPHSDDEGIVVEPVELAHSMENNDFDLSRVNVNRPSN